MSRLIVTVLTGIYQQGRKEANVCGCQCKLMFSMNNFLTICFGSNWVLMFDLVCGLPVGIFLTAASTTLFWLARRTSLDCLQSPLFLIFKSCLASIYKLSVITDPPFSQPLCPGSDLHRSAVPFHILFSYLWPLLILFYSIYGL